MYQSGFHPPILFVYFCLCNLTMEVPRLWGIDRNPRLNCEYLWSNSSKQKAGWAPFFSKDSWCWKINYPFAWGVLGSSNREILQTWNHFCTWEPGMYGIWTGCTDWMDTCSVSDMVAECYNVLHLDISTEKRGFFMHQLTSSWLLGTAQYPGCKPPSMAKVAAWVPRLIRIFPMR